MPVDSRVLEDLATDPDVPTRTPKKVAGDQVKIVLYPPGMLRNKEKERTYILATTDLVAVRRSLCTAGLCINHAGADASVRGHDGSYVPYGQKLRLDELQETVQRWVMERLLQTRGRQPAANERSLRCGQCINFRNPAPSP